MPSHGRMHMGGRRVETQAERAPISTTYSLLLASGQPLPFSHHRRRSLLLVSYLLDLLPSFHRLCLPRHTGPSLYSGLFFSEGHGEGAAAARAGVRGVELLLLLLLVNLPGLRARRGRALLVVRAGAGGPQRGLVQVLPAPPPQAGAGAGFQEGAAARDRGRRRRSRRRRRSCGAQEGGGAQGIRPQGGGCQARRRGPLPRAAAGRQRRRRRCLPPSQTPGTYVRGTADRHICAMPQPTTAKQTLACSENFVVSGCVFFAEACGEEELVDGLLGPQLRGLKPEASSSST
jgi:hypothetical protein